LGPRCVALAAASCLLLVAPRAAAYRPFNGTDADVADVGSFEVELGPAHFYTVGGQSYLLAPTSVLNLGIFEDTEIVVDSTNSVALGPLDGRPRDAFVDTDVFLKRVLREGTLQGKTGLSIAAEGGALVPEINGQNAFGASLAVILSYRWDSVTVHFNEQAQYSRAQNVDLFSGIIVEGPYGWSVRPVSELFVEHEFNGIQTESALVGAIWRLRESFVLDVGFRGARLGDQDAAEVRLGLTWAIPVWRPSEDASVASAREDTGGASRSSP
jgi:hypothetical protein